MELKPQRLWGCWPTIWREVGLACRGHRMARARSVSKRGKTERTKATNSSGASIIMGILRYPLYPFHASVFKTVFKFLVARLEPNSFSRMARASEAPFLFPKSHVHGAAMRQIVGLLFAALPGHASLMAHKPQPFLRTGNDAAFKITNDPSKNQYIQVGFLSMAKASAVNETNGGGRM